MTHELRLSTLNRVLVLNRRKKPERSLRSFLLFDKQL
jgi:hypothetical protein